MDKGINAQTNQNNQSRVGWASPQTLTYFFLPAVTDARQGTLNGHLDHLQHCEHQGLFG